MRRGQSPVATRAVAGVRGGFVAKLGSVAFFLPQFPMGPGSDGPMGGMGGMEPHHMNGSLGERPRRGCGLGGLRSLGMLVEHPSACWGSAPGSDQCSKP